MKNCFLIPLVILCAVSLGRGAEFVHETPVLFTASADVDGDGDADAVIVDKVTGLVTIGVRQADGSLLFNQPQNSGIPNVTGLAVGRLLSTTQDTLALTSPLANRVQVVNAAAPDLLPYLTYYPVAGPRFVAALGSGGLDDMPLAGAWDGETSVDLRLMKNAGSGSFDTAGEGTVEGTVGGWNPVQTSRNGSVKLASLELGLNTKVNLQTVDVNGVYGNTVTASGVLPGSRMLYGQFDVAQSDVMFYLPGTAILQVLRLAVNEQSFLPVAQLQAAKPVAQMLRLKGAVADQVMMIFLDGTAAVYDYTQAGGFTLVNTLDLSAEPGAAQSAVALADGSFALLTGTGADGRPLAHRLFTRDGGIYVAHSGGSLPALGKGPAPWGNVFFFNGSPFLQENTRLVGQWSVGDWSSAMLFGATPQADGENFLSSKEGLGNRFTRQFNPVPTGAAGALANQYRADISLSRLDSRSRVLGDVSGGVRVEPAGGAFSEAVQVNIEAATEGSDLWYRKSNTASFQLYKGAFYLYKDSVVEAYARLPNGKRTPVTTAQFTFEKPPEKQDSDGDGVPDFVELELELEPDGGADSDGDGFSDLEELLAGTSPSNKDVFPTDKRPDTEAKLNLAIQPLPWDGSTNSASYAKLGLSVECHEVDGALLGTGTADKPLDQPVAAFSCQPVEAQQRLLIVSTPLNYSLRTDVDVQQRGRELIGMVAVPDAIPVEVSFQYGGGTSAQETTNWINAATATYAAVTTPIVIKSIGVDDTLVFLLMEARLADLLQMHGFVGSSTSFSLTPFREHEDRDPNFPIPVSSADLLSLERANGDPQFSVAVKLRELLTHYQKAVKNDENEPAMDLLKLLAREVYRVSSTEHDANPGLLKPPVDVLRQFIRFISLDQEYESRVSLTPEQMQQIFQIIYPLRYDAPVRPYVSLTLKVPNSAATDGRTYATSLDGAQTYLLKDFRGRPFELPGYFQVTPGSQFSILAYDDLPAESGGHPLEVYSMTLTTIPLASVTDTDGNLLPDDWELLFFGSMGQDPLSSGDGSGYSLLQEFLAGTDPTDALNSPSGTPATFSFGGLVEQRRNEEGSFVIVFQWSSSFGDAFELVVQESTDMVHFTTCENATIQHLDGDQYQALVPASTAKKVFYRVGIRLP